METNPKQNMRERLMHKIEAHEVSMRPRIFFTLQIVAILFVALAALLVSIFIFNFILFSIRISNEDSFLGFGPRGIWAFVYFFPWWLLLIDVALLSLLERLLRQFKFGYRAPVLYLLFGLLVVTGSVAFAIDRGTNFNERILIHGEHHGLPPPIGAFYGHARGPLPPDSSFCTCIVTAIKGNTLILQVAHASTTLTAVLPPNDPRATTTLFEVGDIIFIAGDLDNGVIRAFGIRRIVK
jgi:hypothetical protein